MDCGKIHSAFFNYISILKNTRCSSAPTFTLPFFDCKFPFTIFLFSFRAWKEGFSKVDYFCLGVSLLALILGLIYKNPILGLTLNILLSDFIAFIPTIIKTYKDPKSENISTWLITIVANILTIAVIQRWTFGIVLLPVYTLIMNSVVLAGALRRVRGA